MAGDKKRCRICHHESRLAIEQAILNGKPAAQVARDFGFTYTANTDGQGHQAGDQVPDHKVVKRHTERCMAQAYADAEDVRNKTTTASIVNRLAMLNEQVDKVITAVSVGHPVMVGDEPLLHPLTGEQVLEHDYRLLLRAVGEGRRNLDLAARLAGKVETEPENLDAIRRHLETPEARGMLARLERMAAQAMDDTPADDAPSQNPAP